MEKILEPSLRFKEFNVIYKNYVLNDILDLLTDFESNGSFASVKENVNIYEEKNYAWYVRATDLENKTGLDKVKYVDEHSYKFLKKTPLFGNELLITKRGEIGKVYFFKSVNDVKATVAPNMYLLKLNNLVDSKYVYYSFINNDGNKKLKRINASTTIGALYKNDVKSIKVKFPKIEEQQKIASFLTDVDEVITNLTKKKTLLEQYKKGVMQKIFNQELRFKDDVGNEFPNWVGKKLVDFKGLVHGDGDWILSKDISKKGDYKIVQLGNIGFGLYVEKKLKTITSDKFIELKGTLINKGDLLINRMVDGALNCCILKKDGNYITSVDVCWIRQNDCFNNYFLMSLILFGKNQNKLLNLSSGSGRVRISKKNLFNEFSFKLPSIQEQIKISNFLSDIDLKIDALNTKIENSKTFKKGLLQQMFV
jgi:type I restriction enzyme S subunit